jgi:hypothetical protein
MSKEVIWNEQFGTGGVLHCTCDGCGKAKDYKFKKKPNYKEVHERLKEKHGWFSRKIGDKWYDFCSNDCYYELEVDSDD